MSFSFDDLEPLSNQFCLSFRSQIYSGDDSFMNELQFATKYIETPKEETDLTKMSIVVEDLQIKGENKRGPKRRQQPKKKQQSISKNNIRNFLTPVIRKRPGIMNTFLLNKEGVTIKQYDAFLRKYFMRSDGKKLKIKQSTFDKLINPQKSDNQLTVRKMFALEVLSAIQDQFIKFISKKGTNLSSKEFEHQLEWINSTNDNLIDFLNFCERKK